MRADGLAPRRWGNGPGDRYEWHEHEYHKVLFCLSGSIVFHTRTDGDLELGPGAEHWILPDDPVGARSGLAVRNPAQTVAESDGNAAEHLLRA